MNTLRFNEVNVGTLSAYFAGLVAEQGGYDHYFGFTLFAATIAILLAIHIGRTEQQRFAALRKVYEDLKVNTNEERRD